MIGSAPISTGPISDSLPPPPNTDLWRQTVISQYAGKSVLLSLIETFNDAVDQSANIDLFYNAIFNVATATGYGLDVWGRIVGVSRVLTIPGGDYFGFAGAGPTIFGFGQAPFWAGSPPSYNYALLDEPYRLLIMVKSFANIMAATTPNYNKLLNTLFPNRGNCYCQDNGNMQMTCVFEFPLQPWEIAILTQSGALSAPTGVGLNIMVIDPATTVGFAGQNPPCTTWGYGSFFGKFL